MTGKMTALQGEAHFFEESMNPAKVKEYLGRPKDVDKLKGMKWLLAMVSKGRDVSDFFSDVVKNMAVKSVEVKKMVYIYLVHYADHNEQCRELALLSINSFQNDLRGSNQLIKALALRVMTSIRVPDIIQIQLLAVRDCASDGSPYVRKCAANAIPKIFVLDPDQGPQLCQVMERLLKDNNTMVLGSAVAAFSEVCPNKFELIHPVYRKLCHLLADVDEWGQMAILAALQRYVRTQFTNPQRGAGAVVATSTNSDPNKSSVKVKRRVVKRAFYSSEEDESTEEEVDNREVNTTTPEVGSVFTTSDADLGGDLDPDHRLLLRCSLPLLKSRNSGVVLAVCTTHYYCGSCTSSTMNQVAKAMVRILRNRREIQFVVLDSIRTMGSENPAIFRPFLQEFFVKASDPLFSCKLKLDVLTQLATKDNCSTILGELQTYVLHRDKSFVCAAVRAVGRVADTRPEVAEQCMQGLVTLVTCSKTSVVVAEAVVVLRQLLQQNPNFEGSEAVVRRLAVLLLRSFIEDPQGEDGPRQTEHEQGLGSAGAGAVKASLEQPAARASIIWTLSEYHQHISGIASDVLRVLAKSFPELHVEVKMQVLNFGVKLALRNPDDKRVQSIASYVLEMARFDLSHDLRDRARFMTAMLGLVTGDQGVDEAALLALNGKADKVLLKRRPAPMANVIGKSNISGGPHLVLGTLSAVVGHRINGYLPMPDWVSVQPDGSVREPPKEEPRALASSSRSIRDRDDDDGSANKFYSGSGSSPEPSSRSGSESPYDSSSGSRSDSESSPDSESGSDSESESTYESGSSEASRSRSSSESESSSDESESSASQGEEGVGLLIMGSGATNSGPSYGASAPAPQAQDLSGLVEKMDVGDREDSSSPHLDARLNDFKSMSTSGIIQPASSIARGNGPTPPVVAPGMLAPTGTTRQLTANPANEGADSDADTRFSFPTTLLDHQKSSGLHVEYQYTRGWSSSMARPTTMLTLRLTLTNHRTTPIRRIRAILPRDKTPMEPFPDVQVLREGESMVTSLGMDFGGRVKEVRFELRTDMGSFMVSIEPPQEELLFPQPYSKADFQRALDSMKQLERASVECQVAPEDVARIPVRTLRALNVSLVQSDSDERGRDIYWFSACSLSGSMSERVFVKLCVMNEPGMVVVDIYSDNPSLPSKLIGALAKAVEGKGRAP